MTSPDRYMDEFFRKHIEKIAPLSDEEFADILSYFSCRFAKKREFLIREKESVPYLFFITSGLVKLAYNDDSGKEHIISFAMEDWWETDHAAFFTRTKATLTLQCVEDTALYCLSEENFWLLCAKQPKWEHFFLKKAITGHIASERRILSFITLNAKDRYEQFLHHYPALLQRLPKSLLASYLGVSRETLSRLF